jgi:hypothetical protein
MERDMLESIVVGIAAGVVFTVAAGIRRWPWRWCVVAGAGWGLVLATLRVAMLEPTVDASVVVLLGALGGSIATLGSERGERERRARSDAILRTT